MRRQYKVATDGKVYFVEDGLLQVLDTLEEYKEMIALKDKKIEEQRALNEKRASTYFEITVEGTYYKLLMVNRVGVFKALARIRNIEERIKEQTRYFKEKEEAGLWQNLNL